MTEGPVEASEAAESGEVIEAQPIPVSGKLTVHGAVQTHTQAADFGAYLTLKLLGTEAPIPLLPYDVNRKIAYVTVSGTGPVYIGSLAGVTAMVNGAVNGQTPAFILPASVVLPVTHKQQVFIAPDGTHSATVSVAIERWLS